MSDDPRRAGGFGEDATQSTPLQLQPSLPTTLDGSRLAGELIDIRLLEKILGGSLD